MDNYTTNQFKSGLKILIDGKPHIIMENEMVKPCKSKKFTVTKSDRKNL